MSDENAGYDKNAAGKPVTLEPRGDAGDGRRFSPSTGRNKDVVREIFRKHMPLSGRVLEIASGTGEHGAHITESAPDLSWVYSDIDPQGRASQRAWAAHVPHDRLLGPLTVDAASRHWGEAETLGPLEGMFNANMIHISPFQVAEGLLAGAGRLLKRGGKLMLYGPFARNSEIAPSNARFSEDLKRRDASWGVRDLDLEILPLAEAVGLTLADVVDMPSNNLSVIFTQR